MKQAISNDENFGSVRLQACYWDEPATWAGLEACDADWHFKSPSDSELRKLEEKWLRWKSVKDQLDKEWLAEQLVRVAEIAKTIDADSAKTRFAEEEAARLAYLQDDAAENQKWIDQMFDAATRIKEAELAAKWARTNRAGADIQRQAIRADNRELLERKRRGRR